MRQMVVKRRRRRHMWIKLLTIFLLCSLTIVIFLGIQMKKKVTAVSKWDTDIERISKEYEIEQYQDIIKAIIMTESKKDNVDIMQSSESRYGSTGNIKSEEESLEAGIAFLAETIELGESEHVDLWTSVQAYNFGLNYIYYVSERGQNTSIELAEKYSKEVLAPNLGNEELTMYTYRMPHAIFYNGGHLYQNGGNFFYADLVRGYVKVLNWFS
ncbi:lysozyme family protein [Vagococcus zengguangii]|nr:lysozyme family protein [Vagococcus zengguangii]